MMVFKSALLAACLVTLSPGGPGRVACGTPDSLAPKGLAKTSDLPAVDPRAATGRPVALLVRVKFPDVNYVATDLQIARIHDSINAMYASMSGNKFQFTFKVLPKIIQLPNYGSYYAGNWEEFRNAVYNEMTAQGYYEGTTGDKSYSFYIVSFDYIGWQYFGLSYYNAELYVQAERTDPVSFNASTTAHELGHAALKLPHASAIEAGSDVFGVPGNVDQNVEYGSTYDIMGWSYSMEAHFNLNYKMRAGWVDGNEVREVKNTGIYRLYAHDNGLHQGRLLGIRVPSKDSRYAYWIEYRTAQAISRGGAEVLFEGFFTNDSPRRLHLLDLTPGSFAEQRDDVNDAVLTPGRQFTDKYGTTVFKTLAINTGTWDQNGWVDMQVTIPGSIPVRLAEGENRLGLEGKAERGRTLTLTGRAIWGPAVPGALIVGPVEGHPSRLVVQGLDARRP